jgi:uncharacterized protein YegP (UPF0339 family)
MYFEISCDPQVGRWSWRLFAATGTVVALGHGYAGKAAAFRDVQGIIGTQNVPVYVADTAKGRNVDNIVLRATSPRAAIGPV